MTDEAKRDIDMSLATATTAAFAIPEAGAFVAAGIGAAQLLFDLFCPSETVDPKSLPPTIADLDAAVNDVVSKIDEKLWQVNLSLVRDNVLAQNDLFGMMWRSMAGVHLTRIVVDVSAANANDGGTYVCDAPDQDLVDELKSYFDLGLGQNAFLGLDTALKILKDPGDSTTDQNTKLHMRTQNISLYCVTASTLIAFLKARVIWRWAHGKVMHWAAYQVYSNEWTNYQKPAYSAKHPVPPNTPLEPQEIAPTAPPDWNDWSKSGPVQDMIDWVNKILLYVEGDGTTSHPGLYTTMRKNWYIDRPKVVADRLSAISIQSGVRDLPAYAKYDSVTSYWYEDTGAGRASHSPPVRNVLLAQVHEEARRGQLINALWEPTSQSYGLDGVDEDSLLAFGAVIRKWKEARASVRGAAYEVQQGDTLSSIAKGWSSYGDEKFALAIFEANRQELTISDKTPKGPPLEIDRVTLNVGQVLMLPHIDDIPHLVVVSPSDTLITLAQDEYGDYIYYPAIYDANRAAMQLAPPTAGNASWADADRAEMIWGQILKLPSKDQIGYSFYTISIGDTLQSIAWWVYGDERYDLAVFKANVRVLHNAGATAIGAVDLSRLVGQAFTLWRKDDVGFEIYTLTSTDQFPGTVATQFYGDGTLTGPIQEANRDWLVAGNYTLANPPGTGARVRVPLQGTNRDTKA